MEEEKVKEILTDLFYNKLEFKMEWILFIFSRSGRHYLVPAGSQDESWKLLAQRQSMSVDRCKKEYSLVCIMSENSDIVKL